MILDFQNAQKALYFLNKEKERREEYFWKTKSGELINIKDMSDTHLNNTIKLLEKHLEEYHIVMDNLDAIDYYD